MSTMPPNCRPVDANRSVADLAIGDSAFVYGGLNNECSFPVVVVGIGPCGYIYVRYLAGILMGQSGFEAIGNLHK